MKLYQVALLLLLLIPTTTNSSPLVLDEPTLDGIVIEGSIVDNYANLTFAFDITNPLTIIDEIVFDFMTDNGLYLSNFSLVLTNLTYWGQVKPIEVAQGEYQNATQNNQTAVLIEKIGNSYQTSFNLQAGETGKLIFFFEGYLKRVLGTYDFTLLDLTASFPSVTVNLEVDLLLEANALQLRSARLFGFNGVGVSKLSSSQYQITYDGTTTLENSIDMRYRYFSDGVQSQLLTYNNGSTNFFMYSFAPEIYNVADIVDREYIFVLDTSGSMNGVRMSNAKIAFNSLLETLTDTDLFNIVAFESIVTTYQAESVIASNSNVQNAQNWVNDLIASGSTNLEGGLTQALDLFSTSSDTSKVVVFLSDGVPTAGVTNENQIISNVKTANLKEATIYSISLGESTAEGLMATVAFQSGGDFVVITQANTLDNDLAILYENFRYPVATGLSIAYTGSQSQVFPEEDQLSLSIFNGSEVIQTGIYDSSIEIETSIITSAGPITYTESATAADNTLEHIERLWAINQINALLKLDIRSDKPTIKAQIVKLALYYQLVVDGYTAISLVVVDTNPPVTEDSDRTYGTTATDTATETATDTETQTVTALFTHSTNNGVTDTVVDATRSEAAGAVYLPISSLMIIPILIYRNYSRKQ